MIADFILVILCVALVHLAHARADSQPRKNARGFVPDRTRCEQQARNARPRRLTLDSVALARDSAKPTPTRRKSTPDPKPRDGGALRLRASSLVRGRAYRAAVSGFRVSLAPAFCPLDKNKIRPAPRKHAAGRPR